MLLYKTIPGRSQNEAGRRKNTGPHRRIGIASSLSLRLHDGNEQAHAKGQLVPTYLMALVQARHVGEHVTTKAMDRFILAPLA